MKIIFMGTPDFAVPALKALHTAGHSIVCVYTQPPRPGGRRGRELAASPVQQAAEALGVLVRHPVSLKGLMEQSELNALGADIAIVAAYGLILPQAILDAPTQGCINIHGSLLPRWRGAAPVQRAILAGDEETGVTIMRMEAGLDTGAMLLKKATPIAHKSAGNLMAELAEMGAAMMVQVLTNWDDHVEIPQPDDGVSYAKKIEKSEARIDFSRSANEVERQIRAFAPAPGAFFEFAGERYRVLNAEISSLDGPAGITLDDRLTIGCKTESIRPLRIQRAGRPAMDCIELLRGNPIGAGMQVGT